MISSTKQKSMVTFLNLLAGYLAFSLVFNIFGYSKALFYPGEFLFKSFNLMGFYVPLLLFLFGYLANEEEINRRSFLSLALSVFPFLNFSILVNLYQGKGPLANYFIMAFGLGTSTMLLSLLGILEILMIVKGVEILTREKSPQTSESVGPLSAKFKEWAHNFSGIEVGPKDIPQGRDTVQLEDQEKVEWKKVKLNPLSQPHLPSPIAPVDVDDTYQQSDTIHNMIQQVLKGKGKSFKEEESVVSPISLPIIPLPPQLKTFNDIEEESDYDSRKFEKSVDNLLGKKLVTENDRLTPPEYPVSPGELDSIELNSSHHLDEVSDEDYFPITSEEMKFNDLISNLDKALEEERPDSIADKLAPLEEGEGTFSDLDPVKPKKRKKAAYSVPVEGILANYPDRGNKEIDDETRRAASILEETLREFKIEAEVTGISCGPVITMFELLPAPGVKLNRIVALQDNIALRLAASRVRIVAPIPGKHAVGIEIPNKKRSIVAFSDLVMCKEMKEEDVAIPIVLGENINGDSQVIDLARTPHLLVAGATGAGKSVSVNSLICSILYHRSPEDIKMILVDPKIVELKLYNDIPHLLTPVITEPKRALQAIQWALGEMERRYACLDGLGVRDIKSYNKRIREREIATKKLPYIVVVIDEFADLMATSGKEMEAIIARLAAMSRAVGIHLVLATQRPSTDVITGLIKANFPSRVAFMVASMTDSRIIIDSAGAEKLLGRGDMLFTSSWDPFPSRVQGAYLSEEEVERVVSYVKTLGEPDYIDDEMFIDEPEDDFELRSDDGVDSLYDDALDIILETGKASASYLQRRLKIGYNRAARLVEDMEMRGIVGPANGSKPREVIHVPS